MLGVPGLVVARFDDTAALCLTILEAGEGEAPVTSSGGQSPIVRRAGAEMGRYPLTEEGLLALVQDSREAWRHSPPEYGED